MFRRLCIFLLLASPLAAEEQRTFLRTYDLNVPTEGADTDQIVASVNLTNTTFTIAAQPDVPRNVTITVTDTTPSIIAGTITITGTDVNGTTITEVLDMAGPTLTFTGTKVFVSVTSVVSADATVLGGAGDETIIVGTGSVVGYLYCVTDEGRSVANAKTASSTTTVTAAVSGTNPFDKLDVGDELSFNVSGTFYRRKIATKLSGSSITVDSNIDLSGNGTSGYPFTYKDLQCGASDSDGWTNVDGMGNKTIKVEVLTMSATGGLDYSLECRFLGDGGVPAQLVAGNIASALVVGVPSSTEAPILVPEHCASVRIGLKYGTTDSSGTDSISAYLRAGQE
jgi:hypothetical protein